MKRMEKRLLIATANQAKLAEYKKLLAEMPIEVIGLSDLGIKDKVGETGNTFEENALLKALIYGKQAKMVTLADDGGFEVDALGGEPGVHSRRWLGREASDNELIEAVIERMKGVPEEKRAARIRIVLAIATPNEEFWTFEDTFDGAVPEAASPNRIKDYPFESVLWVPQLAKYSVDLTAGEYGVVSTRQKLVERALPVLRQLFKL